MLIFLQFVLLCLTAPHIPHCGCLWASLLLIFNQFACSRASLLLIFPIVRASESHYCSSSINLRAPMPHCSSYSFRVSASAPHFTLSITNILTKHAILHFVPRGGSSYSVRASSPSKLHDHTQTHTPGRTPLNEWSSLRGDLYLITHNTLKRHKSIPPAGFTPEIPASEWPQTQALDCAPAVLIGSNVK
jgi:hypothetical protein